MVPGAQEQPEPELEGPMDEDDLEPAPPQRGDGGDSNDDGAPPQLTGQAPTAAISREESPGEGSRDPKEVVHCSTSESEGTVDKHKPEAGTGHERQPLYLTYELSVKYSL